MKKENFKKLLTHLEFAEENGVFTKTFGDFKIQADFTKGEVTYPDGLVVNEQHTCSFSHGENFVVFECIHCLLQKGYRPQDLELEPRWKLGRGSSGGRADILVRDQAGKPLLIIECKTAGGEFQKAWKKTLADGDQLFSYAQQISGVGFLCLYASDFENDDISREQKIIFHQDKSEILKQDENLLSFKDAENAEERHQVWRDTYKLRSVERGIFEPGVLPYQIGKQKYTLEEYTSPVGKIDYKAKHLQFRVVLRQHNIARRENAFEVLVNLFLCKIVDEKQNPQDLKFYWDELAYDNYFDFVDRLQNLYRQGMKKFLKEDISYISDEQVDGAFWPLKNDHNAIKKRIKEYFRRLKFFTNSAFSFVDTHNEQLFYKNTEVLLEIVKMWQNSRLTGDKPNQFLGDMFEFFLDNSIKQSNGQFFTPLPICKFIVASLPLAEKIRTQKEPPKAIDFACGSGHFMIEYAHQIRPILEKQNKTPDDYYKNIIGIEKEYRLAKVAKVASLMYGHSQIKILDKDALASHNEIDFYSFDVLVANPPFAVEGFLQTLTAEDKNRFQLIKSTGKNSDTNVIQCFFLERLQHLMAPNGVVGIIVPSGVLSNNDGVYVKTREMLLKHFDIVSIVELGGKTFGKTGTNTVVLFLQRRTKDPEAEDQYYGRVADIFRGDKDGDSYQDIHLIQSYCRYVGVPFEQYTNLFNSKDTDSFENLFEIEIFKKYRLAWENSTEIKNRQESPAFKKLSQREQEDEMDKKLVDFLHQKERDKLYYYILSREQSRSVLIVKSPDGNREQKQFLGYEWSTRKGKEGIQYVGGVTVNDIVTPLVNPHNSDDPTKINTAIRNNFNGKKAVALPAYCHYATLTDMLDFTQVDFNKAILLNPKKKTIIRTKWPLVKLNEVAKVQKGTSITKSQTTEGSVKVVAGGVDYAYLHGKSNRPAGTTTVSASGNAGFVNYWDEPIFASDCTTVIAEVGTDNYYLFCVLKFLQNEIFSLARGAIQKHVYSDDMKDMEIPLPPLKIQRKIAAECKAADGEAKKSRRAIATAKKQIENKIQPVTKGAERENVGDLLVKVVGNETKIEENKILKEGNTPVVTQGKDSLIAGYTNTEKAISDLPLVVFGDHSCTFKYVDFPFVRGGDGTKLFKVNDKKIDLKYFYYVIRGIPITNKDEYERHFKYLKNQQIPVPPLSVQKKLVADIERLERNITNNQKIIDEAADKKNAILKKHL